MSQQEKARLYAISRVMGSPLRLNGSVARRLATLIIGGHLKPDEILPNEGDLSSLLAVSKTAYREGLRTLAAKGMVDPKPRIGTRVAPRSAWSMLDPDVLTWHLEVEPSPPFIASLFEMRRIVEPAASAIAAERHDAADAARLRAALQTLDTASSGPTAVEADLAFHRAILDATRNEPLLAVTAVIESTMRWSVRLTLSAFPELHARSLPDHASILQAILDRNATLARDRMLALVVEAEANVRQALDRLDMSASPDHSAGG